MVTYLMGSSRVPIAFWFCIRKQTEVREVTVVHGRRDGQYGTEVALIVVNHLDSGCGIAFAVSLHEKA